jgi:hypothetical protein
MPKFRTKIWLLAGLCIVLALTACSPNAELISPTPTKIQPASGMGGMSGTVLNSKELWKDRNDIYVFAAPFTGDDQGQGIYVLEPSIHPHTELDANGLFQMADMPPGKYVLVIGPSPEEALVFKDGDKTRVIDVPEGEVTDVGEITLKW